MERKTLGRKRKSSKGAFSKIFSKKKEEIKHKGMEEESMLEDLTLTSEELLDDKGLWNVEDIKKDLEVLEVGDKLIEGEYILNLTPEDMVEAEEPFIKEKTLEEFEEVFELEDLIKEPGLEEIKEFSEAEEKEEFFETLSQEELQDILKEAEEIEKEGLEVHLEEEIGKEAAPMKLTPEVEELEDIPKFEEEISFEIEKDEILEEISEEISFEFEESQEIAKTQMEELKEEEFEEISWEHEEALLGYKETPGAETEVSPEIEISPKLKIEEEKPKKETRPMPTFELEEVEEFSTPKGNELVLSQATKDALEKALRQAVEDITIFMRDTIKDTIERVSSETIPKIVEKYLRK